MNNFNSTEKAIISIIAFILIVGAYTVGYVDGQSSGYKQGRAEAIHTYAAALDGSITKQNKQLDESLVEHATMMNQMAKKRDQITSNMLLESEHYASLKEAALEQAKIERSRVQSYYAQKVLDNATNQ